jgi:hypothetical protein
LIRTYAVGIDMFDSVVLLKFLLRQLFSLDIVYKVE